MIYGKISNKRNNEIYHHAIVKALDALKTINLIGEQKEYEIDGKDMFIRVLQIQTKEKAEAFPEIHEKYVDLHYMIRGQERIYFSLEMPEKIVKRNNQDDHIFFDQFKQQFYIDIQEGDFAVFFPEDVHMAAIAADKPEIITKAIVKISLSLFNK